MARPIILTVDDEPQVLNALNRDLRPRYGKDYRVLKAGSGAEAVDALKQLKQRGETVALLVSDQRMPEMEGTDFLAAAGKLYPEAKKVLLTAYADTQAAIDSINTIGLDHYLMKPWDPPDQNLFPVLDDLLMDWAANVEVPWDGIRVVGTMWSAASHHAKDFLARNRIPYRWLDASRDPEAKAVVEATTGDINKVPVVQLPNGTTLIQPERRELAEAVGLQTEATQDFYKVLIIGAGPAGLGSAVYAASEGLNPLLIEREATGGQAGTSSRIENYLGFPSGVSGADLAQRATVQATRLGAEILTTAEVTRVRVEEPYKIVTLADGTELSCLALIVASGVSVRRLEVEGVGRLTGKGVYYGAALTEAAHFAGQPVYVIGGANSAGQGAMFFSRYASEVRMLVRGESLKGGMSRYLIDQIGATPNIEVLARTHVLEAKGGEALESLVLENTETKETMEVPARAMFIFIGAAPRTEILEGVVERDEQGYLLTGSDLVEQRPKSIRAGHVPSYLETNVPGIFAAGDVRSGSSKRVATAVGEGAVAVALVHAYLRTV